MKERRQILIVELPPKCSLRRAMQRCGDAIREKHASMLRFNNSGVIGASRLVSITPELVTYEVWLRKVTEV